MITLIIFTYMFFWFWHRLECIRVEMYQPVDILGDLIVTYFLSEMDLSSLDYWYYRTSNISMRMLKLNWFFLNSKRSKWNISLSHFTTHLVAPMKPLKQKPSQSIVIQIAPFRFYFIFSPIKQSFFVCLRLQADSSTDLHGVSASLV